MIELHPLSDITPDDLRRLISGYSSGSRYDASRTEGPGEVALRLTLVALPRPYRKLYEAPDAATIARYREVAGLGFSFGAYHESNCVGLALAEPQRWNNSLWILEFHIDPHYRGRGVGGRLMERITEHARRAGFRTIVCETQNTNVPAIRFYERMGFAIEGIDLSYYSNTELPSEEIAIFMKKRLPPAQSGPKVSEER